MPHESWLFDSNLFILSYKERTKHNVVIFSNVLPNNQIITPGNIELQIQEMTMNEKLTMIGLSKVCGRLNNRPFNHLETYGLFSDFQYAFRSSRSTEDLLAVVSGRTGTFLTGLWLLKL